MIVTRVPITIGEKNTTDIGDWSIDQGPEVFITSQKKKDRWLCHCSSSFCLYSWCYSRLRMESFQFTPQQTTRHARRVYVGGLPPSANEESVAAFFSHVMSAIRGNSTAGPGDAVNSVYINHEKNFTFVEMRSVEEASNALTLDDIIFEGSPVKVKRPTDYNPSIAATLGPTQPNPNLNLAAVNLTPGFASVLNSSDRIFIGGFPYYSKEAQL